MKTRRLVGFIHVLRAITILLKVMGVGPAQGATFSVINTNNTGAGSLRDAITSANLTAGVSDVINFNISGAGPHTISPSTPLPALTSSILIDGYSQSGASSNTLANGDNAVLQIVVLESLVIDTTNSTLRGLAIREIKIGAVPNANGSNVVEGCFVGLDASGTNSLNSPGPGVFVQTPNNRVGGASPGSRNVVSGKGAAGIEVFESFATNNVIQGNFIGTDRTGTVAIGNTDRAVVVNMSASRTTIGGSVPGSGNVISGNLNRGITLDGSNNVVRGNFIGTDVTGLQPLGNARTGIEIGGPGNTIGGTNAGAANVIAFNGVAGDGTVTTNGVDVKPGATNYSILSNSIFDNAGLGIDVNADKLVTAGYPVLTVVSNTGTSTVIRGTHTPSTTFRLELFVNPTVDPSGFGEGKTVLTSTNVTTDAGGNFTINWSAPPITPGLFLTATANGITEFSQARMVTAAGRTNSWTNSLGGKWETSVNWSLNVAPFLGQSLILITNAGSKTVSNDVNTASAFPSTLTIGNLVIGAPVGATNTLLLAHGGTSTPLRISNGLNVNSGGAVVINNGALSLQPTNFSPSTINGAVTLIDGLLNATNQSQVYIGSGGSGSLTVSNGTFQAYYPIVGIGSGGNGVWNIAGGTNIITTVFDIADSLTATGKVVMTGGELTTPALYVGLFGNGSLIVSNGSFNCDGQVLLGSQTGSEGTFIAAGGVSTCANLVVSEGFSSIGNLLVTDTAQVTAFNALDDRNGGTIRLNGGTLTALNLLMTGTSQFVFTRGLLRTVYAAVSNNTTFVVGDATNAAVYGLFGGTNSFGKGLRIAPNATLTGLGFMAGQVTNAGLIDPVIFDNFSGTLLSGIFINGGLVLSNSSELRFRLGGYENNQASYLQTKGSVVLGGKLSVSLENDFQNTITNGSSFVVLTNSTILTGAFTNVASGGQLTTTDGYIRFTVLYAGSTMVRLTNSVMVDSDGDGMPDWWEDFYGLDKNSNDAGLDLDGDGATNLSEYRAGTQPDYEFSVFRVVAIQRETNNVRITWNTVGGKSYRVQTNAVAADGSITGTFADLSPLISFSGDDESTTNYVHVGGFNKARTGFYRVRLAP